MDPPSPPAAREARRVLTSRQQAAFELFVKLGADLREDYSEHELRRAFRTLARQLHPDSHPASSEFEKARLSRQFASLYDAYRLLRPTKPTPPRSAA